MLYLSNAPLCLTWLTSLNIQAGTSVYDTGRTKLAKPYWPTYDVLKRDPGWRHQISRQRWMTGNYGNPPGSKTLFESR